jgi:mannose-6-phosphate isomerase-like protein (cupin superfamily)
MYINSKNQITSPLKSPTGEIIYELIGAAPISGNARLHSLAVIVLPPGKCSSRHYHKHAEETYYILKGQARMKVDELEFVLNPGQALLIEAGEVHQIFCDGDETGQQPLEFLAICAPAWSPDDSFEVP